MYNPDLFGLDTAYPFSPDATDIGALTDIKDACIYLNLPADITTGYCPVGDVWLDAITRSDENLVATIKYYVSEAARTAGTATSLSVPVYTYEELYSANVSDSYILCSDTFKALPATGTESLATCNTILQTRTPKLYILSTCIRVVVAPPAIKKLNGTTVVDIQGGTLYLKSSETVKFNVTETDDAVTISAGGYVPTATNESSKFYGVRSLNGITGALQLEHTNTVLSDVYMDEDTSSLYIVLSQQG